MGKWDRRNIYSLVKFLDRNLNSGIGNYISRGNYDLRMEKKKAALQEKICQYCGKNFVPLHGSIRKYCSKECYWETKKIPVKNFCRNCGKFLGIFSPSRARKKKYCSPECGKEWREKESLRKGTKIEKICKICGKNFIIIRSRSSSDCCSKECGRKVQADTMERLYEKRLPPGWNGGRSVSSKGYIVLSTRLLSKIEREKFKSMVKFRKNKNFGTILEHRYLMAKKLDRPLTSNEVVHHIMVRKMITD